MTVTRAVVGCVGLVLIASCGGADLGECDRSKLGGAATGAAPQPYDGQVRLQQSCGGGRCHSPGAVGAMRLGAPAELDFDVVPNSTSEADKLAARRGFGLVTNHIDAIWEQIDEGTMPPPPPAGAGPMSSADKETVRNWLSCGAPVIEAPFTGAPDADAWTRIFTQLSTQCLGCHSTATAAAGGGFALGDTGRACDAYKNVREVAAKGAACAGRTLVKAGDADNSVLVQKLTAMNVCGLPMPPSATAAMPFASTNPELVNDLKAWIAAGALPPAGCN